jgi:ribonuclease-3
MEGQAMTQTANAPKDGAAAGRAPVGANIPLTRAEIAVLGALEPLLGYRFAQPRWLVEALTHRSYAAEFAGPGVVANERLEFLGDAVLGFVAADLLFDLAPASAEGELTTVRAELVRASTLADFARRIDLGARLRLGRGEEATGGRDRDRQLASALEAVIGALYEDGGVGAVRTFVEPLLRGEAEHVLGSSRMRNDKSLLQHLTQGRLGLTPAYRVVSAEGPDHERIFTVEVVVGDRVLATGVGRNKRQAEQKAARHALRAEGWLDTPEDAAHVTADLMVDVTETPEASDARKEA